MVRKIPLWIIGLMLLLGGCSSKFAYNNLDWLAYWYIDDYIDLDRGQKRLLDNKLTTWLEWHRGEELVKYRQQLTTLLAQHQQGPLSTQQWLEHFEQGRQHWYRLRDKLVPDLVELAPMLTDQQVNHMFEQLEQENSEQEQDRLEKTAQQLQAQRFDDISENITEFVGRLSEQQKHIIKQALPEFESAFDDWIAYRRAWQQAARDMLNKRNESPDFNTSFLHLMSHPEEFQAQRFITLVEHNRMVYARLVADIDQTLTAKQRAKMAGELTDLIEDLDDLIDTD
ncbi:DUF6279 family lipoprotein [Neptunicella sp.]|uniref:DUF6279 family lipoprotein n=1 Tax=Neptunicella sp. TaxID=2125986 RepID=UPI003F691C33